MNAVCIKGPGFADGYCAVQDCGNGQVTCPPGSACVSERLTLEFLGLSPWIDEDMPAGTELERELQQGMKQSCASVFFVTPSYVDEKYLRAEVNYAIAEKRERDASFAIITLLLPGKGRRKACRCLNFSSPTFGSNLEPFSKGYGKSSRLYLRRQERLAWLPLKDNLLMSASRSHGPR